MNRLRGYGMGAMLCMVGTWGPGFAGEPAKIVLPAETVMLRRSTLPGFGIAQEKCGICHSADYIAYQPPGMTLKQWTAEVVKMQHNYGAPIADEEIKQLAVYLASVYGDAATDSLD
jgi:mono/diheme cytochrome c family protein